MMDLALPEDYTGVPVADRGPAKQVLSGEPFYIMSPLPADVRLSDIAHALSMQCRFAGHCTEFYSVAQHSVIVSRLVPREHALWGLLHDAAEAYIGDISRPLKIAFESAAPGVAKSIERRVMQAIVERFDLGPEPHDLVKAADNIALATEYRDLMIKGSCQWPGLPAPLPERIVPMTPSQAKTAFMKRYIEITEMR